MNFGNYLPSKYWLFELNDLKKDSDTAGIIAGFNIPNNLFLFGPILNPILFLLWGVLVKYFLEQERKKKIKAIMEAFPNRYTQYDLELLEKNDRKEFNRLFKLSTDKFFRKYTQEQTDHKKAQQIIIELQKRIKGMERKYNQLMKKENNNSEEIKMLKEQIRLFEEIVGGWEKKAG